MTISRLLNEIQGRETLLNELELTTKYMYFKISRQPQHQYNHVVRLVLPISLTLPDLVYHNILDLIPN